MQQAPGADKAETKRFAFGAQRIEELKLAVFRHVHLVAAFAGVRDPQGENLLDPGDLQRPGGHEAEIRAVHVMLGQSCDQRLRIRPADMQARQIL